MFVESDLSVQLQLCNILPAQVIYVQQLNVK